MLARVSCSDTATQSFSSRKSLQSTTSQRSTQQRQRLWQSLTQPTPCAKQNDPRPVVVELQAITGHPIANAFKAAGEAFNCFLARGRWYTDIQLCIVCIRATGEIRTQTQCQTAQTRTATNVCNAQHRRTFAVANPARSLRTLSRILSRIQRAVQQSAMRVTDLARSWHPRHLAT